MPKITEKKLEEVIKEKSGLDIIFLGRFVDKKGRPEIPNRFALWNKKSKELIGLLESKLRKII